jgi:hypothetical protein
MNYRMRVDFEIHTKDKIEVVSENLEYKDAVNLLIDYLKKHNKFIFKGSGHILRVTKKNHHTIFKYGWEMCKLKDITYFIRVRNEGVFPGYNIKVSEEAKQKLYGFKVKKTSNIEEIFYNAPIGKSEIIQDGNIYFVVKLQG